MRLAAKRSRSGWTVWSLLATMHQLGGLLSLLSGRANGRVFVSVVAYQPDRTNSDDALQQRVSNALSDFSLTAMPGWEQPERNAQNRQNRRYRPLSPTSATRCKRRRNFGLTDKSNWRAT